MSQGKNRKHYFVVGIALSAILLFFMFFSKGLTLDSKTVQSPLIGKAAKEFHVGLLQGSESLLGRQAESLDLADFKGVPLILNFWASWCTTCAQESRILEAYWKAHASNGVRFLSVAVHDTREDALYSIKQHGKTYPIGFDAEGRAALNFGVTGVPETIFINAQGLVVHKELGPVNSELLAKYVAEIKASTT